MSLLSTNILQVSAQTVQAPLPVPPPASSNPVPQTVPCRTPSFIERLTSGGRSVDGYVTWNSFFHIQVGPRLPRSTDRDDSSFGAAAGVTLSFPRGAPLSGLLLGGLQLTTQRGGGLVFGAGVDLGNQYTLGAGLQLFGYVAPGLDPEGDVVLGPGFGVNLQLPMLYMLGGGASCQYHPIDGLLCSGHFGVVIPITRTNFPG